MKIIIVTKDKRIETCGFKPAHMIMNRLDKAEVKYKVIWDLGYRTFE